MMGINAGIKNYNSIIQKKIKEMLKQHCWQKLSEIA